MGKDFWGWAILGPVYPLVKSATKGSGSDAPPPGSTTPTAPKPEDSLTAAQQDAEKRRKIAALNGGQTQQTSQANSYIQTNQVQLKTLLGG